MPGRQRGLALAKVQGFQSLTGRGVSGLVRGRAVLAGNTRLFDEAGIRNSEWLALADQLRRDGQSVIFVAISGTPAGLIGVADPIKASSVEAVGLLHRQHIRIAMLTGDNKTTAEAVAKRLGIDDAEAEVLPEKKAEAVIKLQPAATSWRWRGDGVNDAPALTQ